MAVLDAADDVVIHMGDDRLRCDSHDRRSYYDGMTTSDLARETADTDALLHTLLSQADAADAAAEPAGDAVLADRTAAVLRRAAGLSLRDAAAGYGLEAAAGTPARPSAHPPRTSDARLAESAAASCTEPATVLYLAYGSNMAASTFEGVRGIRPLSAVTAAAPTLRLTFDLPGIAYREPCFANTAARRVPKTPPKVPDVPDIPDIPDVPVPAPPGPPGPPTPPSVHAPSASAHGDPLWDGPLYGVVYEVTRADYARIIATEGGGASYQDVLVPCLAVAPRMGVPEKPVVPAPPRPFLAHTLWAPQLPAEPPGDDNDNGDAVVVVGRGKDDDDDDDDDPSAPLSRFLEKLRRRVLALAAPRARPDPDYAQPSARYLGLLVAGAREHELPDAYQQWLAALQPYTPTTRRQRLAAALLAAAALPFALLMVVVAWWDGRGGDGGGGDGKGRLGSGRMPAWVVVLMGLFMRAQWWLYDHVLHPIFGDGERTEHEGEDDSGRAREGRIRL